MADAFETMVDRLSHLNAKNAALTEAVRVLSEACEKALTLGDLVSRADMALGGSEIENSVRAALTQAKELMK